MPNSMIWTDSGLREEAFQSSNRIVCLLDAAGLEWDNPQMLRQYQERNSFGLDPGAKIFRIFQREYYERDVAESFLTLPLASSSVWGDPLEIPLAGVVEVDPETGGTIHWGAVVSSFYAMCWTKRHQVKRSDWDNFSHGGPAVRISSTVEKLLQRVMPITDRWYMNRAWLIEVDYKNPQRIREMQNIHELRERMESTGAMLALSAAVVRTDFSDEEEVRLLYDHGMHPSMPDVVEIKSERLLRIPFDWSGFVETEVESPD